MSEKFTTTNKVKQLTGTRRKTFSIRPTQGAMGPMNLRSGWDGGSRQEYSVVNLLTGAHTNPPTNSTFMFDRSPTVQWQPAPGDVLIECGTFCGKPSYPSFTCSEADVDALKRFLGLPDAPAAPVVPAIDDGAAQDRLWEKHGID